MWQVRGPGFGFWFWPSDLTSYMLQVRGPWFGFWSLFGTILGSLVWFEVFVECQFQGFGLIWFMRWDGLDFWKLMRLGFFVWSDQLKGGMEPFLYALGERNFD